jgi:pyruvate dehydrogenase E1 component
LAEQGDVPLSKVSEAIKKYGIDPNKSNPAYA